MKQDPRTPPAVPEDNLIASYHAAVAELEKSDDAHASGPSPQVRANVQAYAQQLAQAQADASSASDSVAARADNYGATSVLNTEKPAANDSQWKIRALASIAIFGLTGLLFMQWNLAPQDEKDVAFGTARPAPAAVAEADKAEAASSAQLPSPASTPAPASAVAAAPALVTAAKPASPGAAGKTEASPTAAQTRSKEDEMRAEATAGAPNNAKKSKREAQQADSDALAKAPEAAIADNMKDKAASITRPAPAPQPSPFPASPPAAAPKPDATMAQSGAVSSAPAAMAKAAPPAPAAAARARSSTYEASPAPSIAQPAPQVGSQPQAVPPSPNTALLAAIRNKDAAALQQALDDGADKNTKRSGTPAITLCAKAGQAEMVQLLVNAGADVNAVDAQGVTPLAHARERGLAQIVSILLKAGAKSDTN
jgi:hypothetical protein